jgi:hypothetical protein
MKIVYQESTEDYLVEVIIKEKKVYVLFLDRMSESVRKVLSSKNFHISNLYDSIYLFTLSDLDLYRKVLIGVENIFYWISRTGRIDSLKNFMNFIGDFPVYGYPKQKLKNYFFRNQKYFQINWLKALNDSNRLHNPDSIDCTFRSLHLDYFCYFIDKDGFEQVTEIIEDIDQLLCYPEESWDLGNSDEVEKLCEYFLSNQ